MPIGFHPMEVILLVVIALLFFGPKRLIEMGSAVGKTVREFQEAMREDKEALSDVPSADASSATLPSAKEQVAEPQKIAAPATHAPDGSEPASAAVTGKATTEPQSEERGEHALPS